MLSALIVLAHLVIGADAGCMVVTNTRMLELPSCNLPPADLESLAQDPTPPAVAPVAGRGPYGRPFGRPSPACVVEVRGNDLLERKLALAEEERLEAVRRRVAAEQELEAALAELATLRSSLAQCRSVTGKAGARPRRGPEATSDRG